MYHKALCYCIGMNEDTRRNVDRIYNFKTGCVKPECLHEGWQTSGSAKVVRMAFNLYCNGTPSVDDEQGTEEQVDECRRYSVEDLFCCCYAPYFWQAIQIRYPEYATYNKICMQCLEEMIDVKDSIDGNKNDITWFKKSCRDTQR